MTLQQKIDAILCDPVFSGRLWYIKRPQSEGPATDQYGIWLIVGGESYQNLQGDIDIAKARVQISVYTPESVGSAAHVATVAAVNSAMKAAAVLCDTADANTEPLALYNFSASVPVDGFEDDAALFYSHLDFYAWTDS